MYCKHTFAVGLLILCFMSQLAAAQHYTITDLGPLSPTAINTWGQVVGNYNGHAFMWTKTRGLRDLGTIQGGTFSIAAGINDLGVVTGTADGPGTVVSPFANIQNVECSDLIQPFVWTQQSGMKGLGTVGADIDSTHWCGISFYSTGVNMRGHVIGYTAEFGSLSQYGFVWAPAQGMGLLSGANWPPTFAEGINNQSQIVGQHSALGLPYHNLFVGNAVSWNNDEFTDLDSLGGGFDYGSSATGINDVGQIVGWSTTTPFSYSTGSSVHAVTWNGKGIPRDLGTLTGDISSSALKINFFGQVIGSSGDTIYEPNFGTRPFQVSGRPFIWSERTGMRDLNTLIRGNSKWVLLSATDINVWGQIVGQGTLSGQPHGFLLTPRAFFKF